MKTIFDLCQPRADVLSGHVHDEEFAADLSKAVRGRGFGIRGSRPVFPIHLSHPGAQNPLGNGVQKAVRGRGELNSVIRIDTQYGGGKTHGLIALVHAVRGMQGVEKSETFIDPRFLPGGKVRVAVLDGENTDSANGF